MAWNNTMFRPNMGLARYTEGFNRQQAASGRPQIPHYGCHVHVVYWPEKMTQLQLIGRNVCRSLNIINCPLGSMARLLFMRCHLFTDVGFQPVEAAKQGWHEKQVTCLDEDPSSDIPSFMRELVMWNKHPREPMSEQTHRENSKAA